MDDPLTGIELLHKSHLLWVPLSITKLNEKWWERTEVSFRETIKTVSLQIHMNAKTKIEKNIFKHKKLV